jgi:hypothetical protein
VCFLPFVRTSAGANDVIVADCVACCTLLQARCVAQQKLF